ncbi:hypothetical protein SAMN04488591_1730 [Microbacterium azadirachtae]|uniref:Uncharacterized protein n=1 Tax=Microbacterium azadirachtae TaxID=582680 RepID=A0A1I6HDG3_9MICO|nr:hypothetical protein [Microbacterium azadirachtae]SFR52533.1 hypothetical protein SAMN04488591_1730 [Microbacterium azadirachtae]
MVPSPVAPGRTRRLRPWLIAVIAVVGAIAIAATAVSVALAVLRDSRYTTNVTLSLSYVGDDGQTYSCTYDYSTPNSAPMPPAVARQMNERDWSRTGQRMYEWAKTHRAAEGSTWGLAMDEFVRFPPWQVKTDTGSTHELWSRERPGGTCEDGLR